MVESTMILKKNYILHLLCDDSGGDDDGNDDDEDAGEGRSQGGSNQ